MEPSQPEEEQPAPVEHQEHLDHRPHAWPEANPEVCSCCRRAIVDGLHNVIRIAKAPEVILDMEGRPQGIDKRFPGFTAILHAACWKAHYGHVAECEMCGGFCRIKKLSDGSMNKCACTCHTGSLHCSYILDPNTNNPLRKNQNRGHSPA
jgi:hypothetical protein